MDIMAQWNDASYKYLFEHTRFDAPLLREMEARARPAGFPIIGPLVGPWLYTLTALAGARRVIELGSGFGYSTWYFASALRDLGGGTVTHTVWDEQLSAEAREWLGRAGLLDYCEFHVGEAVAALTAMEPGFDVVFLDIDKEGYPAALEVIEQKLRPGGLLLTDNVLWSGRVLDDDDQKPATQAVRLFNDRLAASPRWDYLINPLRDGLGVARLKE
jgi:caffeoyl-CoA O-methyltransferase